MTRWLAVWVLVCAGCRSSPDCYPGLSSFIVHTPAAGLVGRPLSITFEEHFCQRVVPGALPSLELFGPVNDEPFPMVLFGLELDERHSAVTVHFTPTQQGTYFLKGLLAGRVGVVQELIPVAVDRRGESVRVSREVPEGDCYLGAPFGTRGFACLHPKQGGRFLSTGSGPSETLPAQVSVVADDDAAWVLDVVARRLRRYVESPDGGLAVSGELTVPDSNSPLGMLTRAAAGRVVSSLGEVQVVAPQQDGGLSVERRLGSGVPAACLRGEMLARVTASGAMELYRLDTQEQVTLGTGTTLQGCTGEAIWTRVPGRTPIVGSMKATRADGGGVEFASVQLGSDLIVDEDLGAPVFAPTWSAAPGTGAVDGPIFPVLRGDHLELEYYGPGFALSASEHTVLLRDDAGTWLVTRP